MIPTSLLFEMTEKVARGGWSQSQRDAHVHRRWKSISGKLEEHGHVVGQNKRLLIPKRVLSEQDIHKTLGFVPVNIAVPEAGQTKLRSFRHPDHNYHVHEHGDQWSIHEDEHPSTTMLMHRIKRERNQARELAKKGIVSVKRHAHQAAGGVKRKKAPGYGEVAKAAIQGMPHLIGEGVPGMAYYVKGRVTRGAGMVDKVAPKLPKEYTRRLARLRTSATFPKKEV